jgi:hypothetical protein
MPMHFDRGELRQHFALLNDEELLDLKREDLTKEAQGIYDREIAHRGLDNASAAEREIEKVEASFDKRDYGGDDETADPDWHRDGALVCAFVDTPGSHSAEMTVKAQSSLQAAGIPSHLRVRQEIDSSGVRDPYDTMEVLAPVRCAMHAASILDRDLFNDEFETYWRDHLGMLSNEDLLMLDPDIFCAGLLDKLSRMKRVYAQELTKRELKA